MKRTRAGFRLRLRTFSDFRRKISGRASTADPQETNEQRSSTWRSVRHWMSLPFKEAAKLFDAFADEDGTPGIPPRFERPYLAPIGILLIFTPLLLVASAIDTLLFSARLLPPFITMWIPFAVTGIVFFLVLLFGRKDR